MVIAREITLTESAPGIAPETAKIIAQALKQLKDRDVGYKKYRAYYQGEQPLTFTSPNYNVAFVRMLQGVRLNLCPRVVDAIADRLIVNAFQIETEEEEGAAAPEVGEDGQPAGPTPQDLAARALWQIWRRNRMDLRAGEVHKEAIRCGDAYVIVWPDVDGEAHIYPQDANVCTVHYDEESEQLDWAVKYWKTDDSFGRLNVYSSDRIEKFITRNALKTGALAPSKADAFKPLEGEPNIIANPYGRIPVFHFGNNTDIGTFGQSDLRDVLPLQDALNKSIADLLVGMEFAALPQRWATGLQTEYNEDGTPKKTFIPGIDRIWTSDDANVKFGQFDGADLPNVVGVTHEFKDSVADVTGIPTHYLRMNPGTWPSGESLKTAEAPFASKIRERQMGFGNVWEDVITFCAEIDKVALPGQASTLWQDASPRSDKDMAETAILKKQVGVSNPQLQREMGYSEEQIADMAQEAEAAAAAALEASQQAMNRAGLEDQEEE